MSIAKKLFGPIAILAAVCIGLVACSMWLLSSLEGVSERRTTAQAQVQALTEIRALHRGLQRDTLNLLVEHDAVKRQTLAAGINARVPEVEKKVTSLLGLLNEQDRQRLGSDYATRQARVASEVSTVTQLAITGADEALSERVRAQMLPADREAAEATDGFEVVKREEAAELAEEEDSIRARAKWVILVGGLLGLGVGVTLALQITRRGVVHPLTELAGQMERLSKGDTSTEVTLTNRTDEIGAMARTVAEFRLATIERNQLQDQQAKSMAEQKRLMDEQAAMQEQILAEQQSQLEEAQRQEARARQLSALVEDFEQKMSQSLAKVADASKHLLTTADQMNGVVSDTNERTLAVDAASTQASANVQMVAAATEEMTASIEEISRQCVNAKGLVDQVEYEASETTQKMQSLVRVSLQVAEIVGIIGSVAEQTNLLALNATIEAARAGDSGRGFAVVASEVKQLADQVAQATKEITGKVEAMQAEATSSAEALDRMGATVHKLTEVASVIAAGMEEQNATTQEIARNVQHAALGTGEVATNIRGVSDAAGLTARAAQDVRTASLGLSEETEALRQGIDTFLREVRNA